MSTRLTVIFFIILCLEAGAVLTFLPWAQPLGFGDYWGDNYFLLYAAQKTGLQNLQTAVSSGWVRGAVTGLGLLNFAMAFWEIAHFRRTVRTLEQEEHAGRQRRRTARTTNTTDASGAISTTESASRVLQNNTSDFSNDGTHDRTPVDLPHHER